MGNSSSTPCYSESQYNTIVNQRNKYQREYNKTVKQIAKVTSELNMIKEGCSSGSSVKEKAKEMFNLLENRYLDRLTLIKTQQSMLNKQNVMLSNKNDKITSQTAKLGKYKDTLQTHNRLIQYDLEDTYLQNTIVISLKSGFLLSSIIIIALLIKNRK